MRRGGSSSTKINITLSTLKNFAEAKKTTFAVAFFASSAIIWIIYDPVQRKMKSENDFMFKISF
jgi:hypothetical protein